MTANELFRKAMQALQQEAIQQDNEGWMSSAPDPSIADKEIDALVSAIVERVKRELAEG
jgi:hypothetical protein